MKAARALVALGAVGVGFLCLWGLRPSAVAIPVFMITTCVLFGGAGAALFARVVHLEMGDVARDDDDDWDGREGDGDTRPDPPGGGELEFDWQRFEREFRSYSERTLATRA